MFSFVLVLFKSFLFPFQSPALVPSLSPLSRLSTHYIFSSLATSLSCLHGLFLPLFIFYLPPYSLPSLLPYPFNYLSPAPSLPLSLFPPDLSIPLSLLLPSFFLSSLLAYSSHYISSPSLPPSLITPFPSVLSHPLHIFPPPSFSTDLSLPLSFLGPPSFSLPSPPALSLSLSISSPPSHYIPPPRTLIVQ